MDNRCKYVIPVGEVSFVEMANDENNRPRGCAVIEFESADSVGKAISQMHRYELKGRKLVVKEVSTKSSSCINLYNKELKFRFI